MPMGLDFAGVGAQALNQPLVYLLTTLQGSVAFIVSPTNILYGKLNLKPAT